MKIKSFFKQKRNIVFFSIGIIIIIFIFVFLGIYGPWWRIWPKSLEATIALNRLAILVYKEPYCHQECYFTAKTYEESIIKGIDKEKFFYRLLNIVFNENENINWRIKVLKILSQNVSSFQSIFINKLNYYLLNDQGNLELKRNIIYLFNNNLDLESFSNYLKKIFMNKNFSSEDKVLVLDNLNSVGNNDPNFYIDILETEIDVNILNKTLRIIGLEVLYKDYDKTLLINSLENIIRNPNSNFTTRRLSVFILAVFLDDKSNNEVYTLFKKMVDGGDIDIFTRYLIIDIFNNYLVEKYELPLISEEDWNLYYQNY